MADETNARLLEGLQILVVDDAADNRLLVTRFLQLAGAHTDVASDGAQGIGLALSKSFDVVLMDIQMPSMDGYEAVSRLRAHHYSSPIIALTAHAMRSERERCLTGGFDAYLTKPISRVDLLKTIRTLADRHQQASLSIAHD
jgi:CheY-like chemotaxis protein